MTDTSPDQPVRDLVARADQRRRARTAADRLRTLAPVVAALALGLALAARFLFGWPAWMGVAALVAGAVALGAYVAFQRRARPTTDAIASAVDSDAQLIGELRSAHWFEAQADHDPWATFHLNRAADHARTVDWTALYPRTPSARAWAATAILSVAVIALAIKMPTPAPAAGDAAARSAEEIGQLPLELQKKLAALLAQMEMADGKADPNAKELAVADLKDLMAKLDPAMQKKLADMLEKRMLDKNAKKADAASKDDERADRAENSTAGLPEDVKWALENAAAKMAQSSDDRKTNDKNPSASTKTGETGAGSPQAQQETAAAPTASPLVREAANDPGGKMMMGGGGPMGGDSRPGAGGNNKDAQGAAEALLVLKALRKELVEASADALGENVDKEDLRRKTEQGKSTLGFTRVAEPRTFEPSRATAPPPVPEARRSLLFNYFIRRR